MGRCANENGLAKALSHLENASYPDSIRELRSRITNFKTRLIKRIWAFWLKSANLMAANFPAIQYIWLHRGKN